MSDKLDVPFAANEVRLSPREWIVTLALIAVSLYLIPIVWRRAERLEIGPDHRVPYSLGYDYWMYGRYCRAACAQGRTLVVGDSVVWGHYVAKDQTLSHHLNELARDGRFANLGVDGIHPAAMAGLLEYHGRAIAGGSVILHGNLLWMSSERHDLQSRKEFAFNHPSLVPQFFPRIPCYRESWWNRIGIVARRQLSFCGWADHVRFAYLGRPSLLRARDVLYWPQLCARLKSANPPGAGSRTWQLLPPEARTAVEEAAQEKETGQPGTPREKALREARRSLIIQSLNAILRGPDFYREDAFRGIELPLEARELLGRDREALSEAEVKRLNRLLLRAAYPQEIAEPQFEDENVVKWPVEHPYENPVGAFSWGLPSPNESPSPRPDPRPWTEKKDVAKFNPPWVELETSFQWASFRRTVEILQGRGNRVFVLLGPFNEHMLKEPSLEIYRKRTREAEAWLRGKKIPYYIPPALPSDRYADASHPLGNGYAMVAKQLFENEAFARFDAPNRTSQGHPR